LEDVFVRIVGGEEEDGALLGWLTGTEGTL